MDWVAENAQSVTSDRELAAPDLIILSIFCRSTRTYEAVVRHLGERGFGEQGLMLTRALWEDMVDIHWVAGNENLAVERLQQHDLNSRLLRADTQRAFPEMFDGRKPAKIKVTNEQRQELVALFGRGGSNSWTGPLSTQERLESVLSSWRTEEDRRMVRFWQAWVVKLLNETIHPSAHSIGRIGSPTIDDEQALTWRFGSTPEWLTQALHAAWWTYQQTVGLVVDRYAPARESELVAVVTGLAREFRLAHRWEATGRLESLPSDSGQSPTSADEESIA